MPRPPDYYEILGVDPDADMRAVKRAWREAARTLHPDLPDNRGNSHAKRRFKLVKEAYEVLSDPVRRQEFDERGSSPFLAPGTPFAATSQSARSTRERSAEDIRLQTDTGQGVASIFADLFGGGHAAPPPPKESPWNPGRLNREGQASRPADQAPPTGAGAWDPGKMESDAKAGRASRWGFDPEALAEAALKGDLSAADAATQARPSSIRLGGRPPSPGAKPPRSAPSRPTAPRSAPPRPPARRRGDDLKITAQVPFRLAALGGRHTVQYRAADSASGYQLAEAELFLPAGIADGTELVLAGKGPAGDGGGAHGDLRVTVYVEEHPQFVRRDRDVVVDLPLSPWEAATGCTVEVPTLHGRQKVNVPPGVRSGQKLRLRGLGLAASGGQPVGNQELVIQIHLPEPLSARQLELLQELEESSDWDPRGRWPAG